MNKVFEKLNGLDFESGAALIRNTFVDVDEHSSKDGDCYDLNFRISEGNVFTYRTEFKVECDEDVLNLKDGIWSAMIDGEWCYQ